MNLYDDPTAPVLSKNMKTCMGIMIEKLIKLASFLLMSYWPEVTIVTREDGI